MYVWKYQSTPPGFRGNPILPKFTGETHIFRGFLEKI